MSSKNSFYKSKRVCVIVTGSSKGFGRTISILLAKHFKNQFPVNASETDSARGLFVLMARSQDDLMATRKEIESIDQRLQVVNMISDLYETTAIQKFETTFRNIVGKNDFEHLVLVHNAGSIGDPNQLCKKITVDQFQQRNQYYRLNLFSVMELTAACLRLIDELNPNIIMKHIINVSSLAAVKPLKGLVDYCLGKAARETYFKCLIDEEADNKIRALNYSPGPLDTEMFRQLQTDSILKNVFQSTTPLTTEQSGEKLLKILVEDQYENGSHIDYYDIKD